MSPRRFDRRTYMIVAAGWSALAFKAAMSASSASTTIRSAFPFTLSPTVNCHDIFDLPQVYVSTLFAEQRKHLISHQVNCLCHAPNIDARFETLEATSKDGPHISRGQNFSCNQMFNKRQGGHAIGDRNALSAAAKEVEPSGCRRLQPGWQAAGVGQL